jgi:thiosulfate/3-mercaptopyruvate sulfurtransferase
MSRAAIFLVMPLLASLWVGCQSKPTKTFESNAAKLRAGPGEKNSELPQISIDTVIIDARPAFEYSLSHLNGAINLRWDDFTLQKEPFRGLLDGDLYFHARRLARLGIGPDTPVVVVGRGQQGKGEEGRLAWTLKYLGIKNVSFAHIDVFDRPRARDEAPPREPVPIWKPVLDDSLIVDRAVLLKRTMRTSADTSTIIIDVRPPSEYLGKATSKLGNPPPDLGAINIPWNEFITHQGTANLNIKEMLLQVEISPEKEIIVLSNGGIESATATLVLRELGFTKAANYAGGYMELMAEPKRIKGKKGKR